MNSPKAVVFDLGKVLLNFDYAIAASKLAAHCLISADKLQTFLNQSPLFYRYETGLVTTEEFFTEIQRLSGYHGDLAEFGHVFGDIFEEIGPMVQLHSDLRARGVPTYLFSNTNQLAVRHIRRRFPFFEHFQAHILSYEQRAMKPDPKIYEVVEKHAGYHGPDLLYLDDRPENIATGQQRGWQTILHLRPEDTIAAVRRTGIFL